MRLAAVALALAVAAACSGDSAGSTAARGDLCQIEEQRLEALSDVYDAAVRGADPAELQLAVDQVVNAGRALVASAPDDVADDARVVADAGERLADALAEDGPGPNGVPDELTGVLASPDYTEASNHLTAALQQACGADPGGG